jgi:class 3 adenylate cyclase
VPSGEISYRFLWQLEASPEALWPYVADTNRFNRETGAPEVVPDPGGSPAPGVRRLRLRAAGRSIPFEEAPFEWVRPRRFGVERRYEAGPLATMRVLVELEPRAEGGTTLAYGIRAMPRGALGRPLTGILLGRIARRRFERAFRDYDRLALAQGAVAERHPVAPVQLVPGGPERLQRARDTLLGRGLDPALIHRLATLVEGADDLDVARLRPYALADAWGRERREVLELCLSATREGLLESRWELLCPYCRGAAQGSEVLAGLGGDVHCDACGIDVGLDFESSVELVFHPSAGIREVAVATYCLGGPQTTPHVVAQQRLAAGEHRTVRLAFEPGSYRVRAGGLDATSSLAVADGGAAEAALTAAPEGVGPRNGLVLAPLSDLTLRNETGEERLLVAERTAWADDAATAADVTALQAFRDLFATDALRPGEQVAITSLTIVFTDLRDSTRLYRSIGDAPAFGSVAGHFDVLRGEVARAGGAVVKTIGDAVMAAFRRPVAALEAMLDAQAALAGGVQPLLLKVGIHEGPCLAVTLNERLDYFGSTVNAAARIVGLSGGHDVVVSGTVRDDPEVAAKLADGDIETEPVEAVLKGFDDAPFELWRVRRAD